MAVSGRYATVCLPPFNQPPLLIILDPPLQRARTSHMTDVIIIISDYNYIVTSAINNSDEFRLSDVTINQIALLAIRMLSDCWRQLSTDTPQAPAVESRYMRYHHVTVCMRQCVVGNMSLVQSVYMRNNWQCVVEFDERAVIFIRCTPTCVCVSAKLQTCACVCAKYLISRPTARHTKTLICALLMDE